MTDISIWQFPLSLILAIVFLTTCLLLWKHLPEGELRRILSGRKLCLITIIVSAILTAIEGTWAAAMHRNPLMWTAGLLMMVNLYFDIAGHLENKGRTLSHAGMFIMIFGAFWGAPDMVNAHVAVFKDEPRTMVVTNEGEMMPLPFSITLEEFRTDYYDDGVSPKQYSSDLLINGRRYHTSVNHPCMCRWYLIYQSDFDHENGEYSVLSVVKDPWLPLVLIGVILLAAGAFVGLGRDWKSKWLIITIVIVAVLFAVLSVARINFKTLMPALRSLWFVPHLVLYMLAYSSLAISLVLGILYVSGLKKEQIHSLSFRLFKTSSALLLLGMMCGAVWAKICWGDWWTWDAKECWAAVTWLLTLAGMHLPAKMAKRDVAVLIFILLAFLAMQIAWYGVEWLPASQISMHTYK